MDFSIMAKNLEVDEEMFLILVESLIKTVNKDLEILKESYGKRDIAAIVESSHRIKGSSIQLGFTELAEPAKIIEFNARNEKLDNFFEYISVIEAKRDEIINIQKTRK
ncbi:MAG: Hpt domain-containing protein [Candidatus Wallbacteria bacterium]